ncbi:hypothetical protein [Bosea beijingensis]|uniref:hypothetical protein n=1 Tax=Bosea beijingensis TaxID=3068632 RepID=UPI0027414EC8|nr:hypothetical protein [Bosea sp. REN20]
MNDPEPQPPRSDPPRDEARTQSKIVGLLLMSAMSVTMTAWIALLGWTAWTFLGDG